MAEYANPEVLVTTDWVAEHKDDPNVVVVEVNVDNKLYDSGHIPGAVGWNWKTQLSDAVQRDVISKADFEKLMSDSGATPESTVVLYGDSNNWFAAWGAWIFNTYGFEDVRLLDGGRVKWEADGRALSTSPASFEAGNATVAEANEDLRARLTEVLSIVEGDAAGRRGGRGNAVARGRCRFVLAAHRHRSPWRRRSAGLGGFYPAIPDMCAAAAFRSVARSAARGTSAP